MIKVTYSVTKLSKKAHGIYVNERESERERERWIFARDGNNAERTNKQQHVHEMRTSILKNMTFEHKGF